MKMKMFLQIRRDERMNAILKCRTKHQRGASAALRTALDRYDRICAAERRQVCLSFVQLVYLRRIARSAARGEWAFWTDLPDASLKDKAEVLRVAKLADGDLTMRTAILDGFEQADIAIAAENADELRSRQILEALFRR